MCVCVCVWGGGGLFAAAADGNDDYAWAYCFCSAYALEMEHRKFVTDGDVKALAVYALAHTVTPSKYGRAGTHCEG